MCFSALGAVTPAEAEDPVRNTDHKHLITTAWEDTAVGRPGALTFGLNGSCGIYAGWGACVPRGSGGFTVYRPEHWAFEGTDLYYGDQLGAEAKVFGYAVDRVRRGSGMIACFDRGKGSVFNVGSCEWVAGLIAHDPFVARLTKNVLARFTQSAAAQT